MAESVESAPLQNSHNVPRTTQRTDQSADWSPWVRSPSLRSLAREQRAAQRFSYNPYRTPRFLPTSPYAPSPVAQVVPGTPVGAFVPPSPSTPVPRTRRSTPRSTPRNGFNANTRHTPAWGSSLVSNERRTCTPKPFASSLAAPSNSKETPRVVAITRRHRSHTCTFPETSDQLMNWRSSNREVHLEDEDYQSGHIRSASRSLLMESGDTTTSSAVLPISSGVRRSQTPDGLEHNVTPRRATVQTFRCTNDGGVVGVLVNSGNGSSDLLDALDGE